MFEKNSSSKRSQTKRQFELFLKKRNEKSNILKSQTQSVNAKVKCFEELIRLNRKGSSVNHASYPINNVQKYNSSNNILYQPQPFIEVQQEDAQFCFERMNKMAHELKSWEQSKQVSKHTTIIKEFEKTTNRQKKDLKKSKNQEKVRNHQSNSTNSSRLKVQEENQTSKDNWLVEVDKKTESFPIKKKNKAYLCKKQFSTKHFYQNSTPNLNINIQQKQFNGLKKKIDQLQNKAKQAYGINFELPKDEEEEHKFQEPVQPLRKEVRTAFERTRVKRNEENNYITLMNEHMKQDSSIPSNFLGIIRSKQQFRPVTNQIWRRYIRI